MKQGQILFHRKCYDLANRINRECQTFMVDIRYHEYLHNVYYENGMCFCYNRSERRLPFSDIEKCRYKNRIQVKMIAAKKFTKSERRKINKILKTNVTYVEHMEIKWPGKTYCRSTEIIFNVNPHKM